jgi:hypothetical protein
MGMVLFSRSGVFEGRRTDNAHADVDPDPQANGAPTRRRR